LQDAFIAANQQSWPVAVLGAVLGGGRSGFSDSLTRQAPPALSPDEIAWLERSKAIAEQTAHRDGSRRLTKPLQAEGYEVGRFTGRRLLKQAGVSVAGRRRRGPKTPESRHGYGGAPHLRERTGNVLAPHGAWWGDSTDIWPAEGGLSPSGLLDLYARKVVGWAMREHVETQWVSDAWEMALGRRRPEAGLLHQSARGAQYACHAYRGLLAAHGMACRMRGKGECLDNAVAERFCGSLQRERTSKRYSRTRQEARDGVIDYIERFDNSGRKHAYLGYVSPNEYEKIARVA